MSDTKEYTPKLIVIVGPTAVGKTDISVKLAKAFGCSIISADSRQCYKEMTIGTAKPAQHEMDGVAHYFVNDRSIERPTTAGIFANEALSILENTFSNNDVAILSGGSGLYVDAVCKGLDAMPNVDAKIRVKLNKRFESEGITHLLDELKICDPDYYALVDKGNPHRIIRGLEIFLGSGSKYSSFRTQRFGMNDFEMVKIGLDRPREELYARINSRMDKMLENGLEQEAKELYPKRHLQALQTVGYSEIFGYFDGNYDRTEMVRLLKRNSRRFAKRQLTWFRRDQEIKWFNPSNENEIIKYLSERLDT